ncbi:MAG: ABC transporter permease [Synergistaceae bacterium]|jgi:oligopeptide transport system permease protein|nr:ABC transporter permease [Synergistaceae bacterium]
MAKYILKRLAAALISMFVLITLTFFLLHAVPGNPFNPSEQRDIPPKVLENLKAKYGLDLPIWRQYLNYMNRLLHGDLGSSFKKLNYTVNELIFGGFPASAWVGMWTILFSLAVGIPLGIIAALKRGGWMDWCSMIMATIGVSVPTFVFAMLLMYVFAMKLGLLPVYGYGTAMHMIIPVIGLSHSAVSQTTRLMRSSMLEVSRQDYMRTARAKGVPEFMVIAKHGMRNSILPVVTYIGPLVATLLTGSFVIERLFMIPGIGRYFVTAVSERDYSVVLGITIFYGAFMLLCTLIVDIAYAVIDPRVKFTD